MLVGLRRFKESAECSLPVCTVMDSGMVKLLGPISHALNDFTRLCVPSSRIWLGPEAAITLILDN